MKIKTTILTLVFSTFFSLFFGGVPSKFEGERDVRTEYSDFKNHTYNHSFKLFKYETEERTKYVSFPLPIILWDNGIQIFLSSEFYFGKKEAEHNGNFYKLYHNKIYKTDEFGTINYDENDKVLNEKPLDFSITKNVVLILICLVLMMVIFGRMAKSYKNNPIPTGIGRLLAIVLYIRDDIVRPNIGEKHYKRYEFFTNCVFLYLNCKTFLDLLQWV